jgi:hypothetical protein
LGVIEFLMRDLFMVLGCHLRGLRVIRKRQAGKRIPLGELFLFSALSLVPSFRRNRVMGPCLQLKA